jgi:hypothetical protein
VKISATPGSDLSGNQQLGHKRNAAQFFADSITTSAWPARSFRAQVALGSGDLFNSVGGLGFINPSVNLADGYSTFRRNNSAATMQRSGVTTHARSGTLPWKRMMIVRMIGTWIWDAQWLQGLIQDLRFNNI